MSRKPDRSPGFFGMGTSLLLTVLLVLMLVTFSLLSLSTARSDLGRSELLAQRRTAYYEANNLAEQVLCQLKKGEQTTVPVAMEEDIASFVVPMTEGQNLVVQLRLHSGGCTILRWEVEQEQK